VRYKEVENGQCLLGLHYGICNYIYSLCVCLTKTTSIAIMVG